MENKQEGGTPNVEWEAEHLCRSLIEASPLPMAAVNGDDHRVQYVNPAFCSLVARTSEELLGCPFAEAIPEAGEYLERLDRVARTGGTEYGTEEEHSALHSGHWAYGVWAIINPGQQPIGVMVHLSDATESVRLRERLVALNQELLLSAVRQQQISEEHLQSKNAAVLASEAKDQFMAVMSHELRTPLTPVLAAVSMLQRKTDLDPATQETLRMIRRNVEMEARLINDLLDLTSILQGKLRLERAPIDLGGVIASAVEVCELDLRERKIEFGVDAPDRPYFLDGDFARLRQVLSNLLKNAVKFTPSGGCIGVRCRREGDEYVVVEVNDSGRGIAPETLPQLFQPFKQGSEGITRQFGGLGLGLAICKSLVEQHGGTIEAHSEGEGKGSSIRVRLPLLHTSAIPDAVSKAPEPHGRPLRILYVEDHGDTASLMRDLMEMEGHRVQMASDMATALEAAGCGEFDVLLSDLGLPGGSGLDLMRELRSRGYTFPAIALSGYGHSHNIRESQEAGFDLHLVKPVSIDQLLQALAESTSAQE